MYVRHGDGFRGPSPGLAGCRAEQSCGRCLAPRPRPYSVERRPAGLGIRVVASATDSKEAPVASSPLPLAAPAQPRIEMACVPVRVGTAGYEPR